MLKKHQQHSTKDSEQIELLRVGSLVAHFTDIMHELKSLLEM